MHLGRWTVASRPLMVGMVHGLAGSGALTTLVMAKLPTVPAQIAYMAIFGAGSALGMAALTGGAGWPLARFIRRPLVAAGLSGLSGVLSLAYGVASGWPIVFRRLT